VRSAVELPPLSNDVFVSFWAVGACVSSSGRFRLPRGIPATAQLRARAIESTLPAVYSQRHSHRRGQHPRPSPPFRYKVGDKTAIARPAPASTSARSRPIVRHGESGAPAPSPRPCGGVVSCPAQAGECLFLRRRQLEFSCACVDDRAGEGQHKKSRRCPAWQAGSWRSPTARQATSQRRCTVAPRHGKEDPANSGLDSAELRALEPLLRPPGRPLPPSPPGISSWSKPAAPRWQHLFRLSLRRALSCTKGWAFSGLPLDGAIRRNNHRVGERLRLRAGWHPAATPRGVGWSAQRGAARWRRLQGGSGKPRSISPNSVAGRSASIAQGGGLVVNGFPGQEQEAARQLPISAALLFDVVSSVTKPGNRFLEQGQARGGSREQAWNWVALHWPWNGTGAALAAGETARPGPLALSAAGGSG